MAEEGRGRRMDVDKLVLNPARLRIMQHLRLHGRVRTSELVAHLDFPTAEADAFLTALVPERGEPWTRSPMAFADI